MPTPIEKNSAASGYKPLPTVVGQIIVLCRGATGGGHQYWAYMCMLPNQAEMFYEARKRGKVQLEDYGTLLEFGQGEDPPADVQDRMRRQFGAKDDLERALIKLIEQQGGAA